MVKKEDIFFFHRPKEIAEVTLNGWGWSINRNTLLGSSFTSEDVDDFSRQI